MKKQLFLLPLLFFFFAFPQSVSAQVLINEFVPDASQEWVEFFNGGASQIDLSKYFFDDDVNFDSDGGSSGKITLKGLLDSGATCYWNLSTYLNNSGDSPTLFNESGNIIDTYTYSSSTKDKSYSRVPDGGSWEVDQIPTKSSIDCKFLAPSPSPSPTSTPTPESSPSPTEEPTNISPSTPKPTVKATSTPKPTRAPISQDDQENNESLVLGLREELNQSPSPTPEAGEKKNLPFVALGFVFLGAGLLGFAGYSFFKQKEKGYTNGSESNKKGSSFS